MDMNKVEINVVADVVAQAKDDVVSELLEMQLALCGGGVGEVVLA